MNYERASDDGLLFILALILGEFGAITMVASKFVVVNFPCALGAVSK